MSSKRRIRRNACRGKVRFQAFADAFAAIGQIRHRGLNKAGLRFRPYVCGWCHGIHVGHTR